MPNLSIKNVPPDVVEKLRHRAAANHRSLQGELMALVTDVVNEPPEYVVDPSLRGERRGYKTIEQIMAEHRERGQEVVDDVPLAVDIVRADRDSR